MFALLQNSSWKIGDFTVEEGLKELSSRVGLNSDQELIISYHLAKFAVEKDSESWDKLVDSILSYSDISNKFADFMLQKHGVDINAPKNKDEARDRLLSKEFGAKKSE